MKHKIQNSLIAMLAASAIFVSCSKDESLTATSGPATSAVKTGKPVPVDNGIMGTLSPAPAAVQMKVFEVNGHFSADVHVDPDGAFRILNLPVGLYYLYIAYLPANSPDDVKYSFLIVDNIAVEGKGITDLGTIRLP